MEEKYYVKAMESGDRVDALLAQELDNLTRSAVQRLIEDGSVLLNGKPVKKNYKCNSGDEFEITLPPVGDIELIPENIPLNVVFEDNDLIVINKERGMVVHPAPGHSDGTLVNALLYHCGDSLSGIGGEKRPGIVHRIDKDTSGMIIVAKNDFSHQFLSNQLSDHTLHRVYECIVKGRIKEDSGIVDAPIGRHPTQRKKMAVTQTNSKWAKTHYEVVARYNGYTHVRCKLETGRTHQIRVHMAHIGHPLLGDYTYGAPSPDKGLEGQCLHARELSFIHPATNQEIHLTTDLPDYFTNILNRLGPEIP